MTLMTDRNSELGLFKQRKIYGEITLLLIILNICFIPVVVTFIGFLSIRNGKQKNANK